MYLNMTDHTEVNEWHCSQCGHATLRATTANKSNARHNKYRRDVREGFQQRMKAVTAVTRRMKLTFSKRKDIQQLKVHAIHWAVLAATATKEKYCTYIRLFVSRTVRNRRTERETLHRVSLKNWTICYFIISLLWQLRIAWKFSEVHRRCYLLWIWNKIIFVIR